MESTLSDAQQMIVSGGQSLPDGFVDATRRILEEGTAANTLRAYGADLRYWAAWSELRSVSCQPCSVDAAIMFVVDHLDGLPAELDAELCRRGVKSGKGPLAISTIRRRVSSLSALHRAKGLTNPFEDPRFRLFLSKAGRAATRRGYAPRRKSALVLELLQPLMDVCGDDLRGKRDLALVLFAFASGGRRRSEVASAVVERLVRHGDDFVYEMGVTKTSQDGDAGTVPVAGRAAAAMDDWLSAAGITKGPIFRAVLPDGSVSARALAPGQVNRIVKRLAAGAGFDPSPFGAHSLRSGFMTETGLQGVSLVEAMELSLHSDIRTAGRYHQAGRGLKNKAARILDSL